MSLFGLLWFWITFKQQPTKIFWNKLKKIHCTLAKERLFDEMRWILMHHTFWIWDYGGVIGLLSFTFNFACSIWIFLIQIIVNVGYLAVSSCVILLSSRHSYLTRDLHRFASSLFGRSMRWAHFKTQHAILALEKV